MSARNDFLNNMQVDQILNPAFVTVDTNVTSVDLLGYEGVTFLALIGASGDTLSGSVFIELEVEHSDDDTTFADAADADIRDAVAGTNTGTFAKVDALTEDDALYKAQYVGSKRYVRPVINLTGTHTNGTPIGIVAVRHGKQYVP